jgi:hypothetical protein
VDHPHPETGHVQLQRLRSAPGGDVRTVVVAEHGVNRRVGGQLVQYVCRADVASVQNQVRTA